ncbi:MAG: family intrarane metalloprotease [Sphingobacteriales bacterium]|nr:family intrarane metalloprotease [Sphingobacteriales bacterium]
MDLIVELALSWLLLWWFHKANLGVLGIYPAKADWIVQFLVGLVLSSSLCALNYLLQTVFSGSIWLWNNDFTLSNFLSSSWWVMHSVLYEELIFRGALLYIAIQKLGVKKASILSAICFGVYHWFSMNAFGNWIMMTYLFIGTGIMGYVFALTYAKTNSLYLPIGLHFGWNLINTVIFSQGPIGNQLLTLKVGERFNTIENMIVLFFSTLALPLISLWYLKFIRASEGKPLMI